MRYNNATFTMNGISLLYIFRSSGPLLGHKKAVVVVGHCVGEGVGRVRASRINAIFPCNQLTSSPNETYP